MKPERPTRLDLEQFHDGALQGESRERVAERLRADPATRERLSRVRDLDESVRRSLLDAWENEAIDRPFAATVQAPPVRRSRGRWGAIAAAALLASGVALNLLTTMIRQASPSPRAETRVATGVEESLRRTARETGVLVLLMSPNGDPADTPPSPPRAPSHSAGVGLLALVGEGSLSEAFDAARGRPEALSDDVLAALGERVLSGDLAREFLESLPPERRADAVRVWADNPRLRPAAFDHLRALLSSSDDAARLAGERARDTLASRSELATWIASYARRAH